MCPDKLISYIQRLNTRGFTSGEFRRQAAKCLRDLAVRLRGLDRSICQLLEQWLIESAAMLDRESRDDDRAVVDGDRGNTSERGSFLWDGGDVEALPSGSFPILDALSAAYLCQEPVDTDGWLGILERHIVRPETPKVWIAMTRYLPFLVQAQRATAVAFIQMLLERYPEILNHQWGVHMVGQIIGWIPSGLLNNIVDSWIGADWQYGPQVAGEVIAFALCRNVGHEHMWGRVRAVVRRFWAKPRNAKMIRVGIAHTLIVALREPELRFRATRILIRIFGSAANDDEELNKVLHRIFSREAYLCPDAHTERLLQACVRRPKVLTAGAMGLSPKG